MPEDIIILHKCTKNHDHMLYCSWNTAHDGCKCYFSFWAIFCPFTAPKMKVSQKKKRKKKTPGDVIILHMCTKNYDQVMYGSWEMVCKGWADGQKKWHIEVGAPPKNKNKKLFEVVQKAMESCFHFKKLYIVLVWLLWMFVKKFFFKQHVSIILWSFSS